MEQIINAIILGVIQGLTEFLPISSSGHLEIAKSLLGDDKIGKESMLMTTLLHAATALSIIYVFRKDITAIIKGIFLFKKNEELLFSLKILLSMIPAVAVGFLLEEEIESLFGRNLIFVGTMLLVTALLLFLADKSKSTKRDVSIFGSVVIGVSQAIAILPGISRSGATISTAVLLGIDKIKAAKFSFLMVVPLILGKMAKDISSGDIQLLDRGAFSSTESLPLLFGFISAYIVGVFACRWMIKLVEKSQLKYFSVYCLVVAVAIIISSL